jgi:FimV-like protein
LALGLGDIHVQSALHEPLTAQIDLIDATPADLASLSAEIAAAELFQRYSLERPSFLSSTALRVIQDNQGRPALALRSTAAFTEPVVTFLVAVHGPGGELVREYTVLLDPPGLMPEHDGRESTATTREPTAASTVQTSAPVATPKRPVATPDTQLPGRTYTVAPRDTLDRIVRIAGAHSRTERHRMMIAIFRGNPAAFQANLNILRSGAALRFPGEAELAAISANEADQEFASHMAAWRATDHRPAAVAKGAVHTGAVHTGAVKPVDDAKPDTQSQETQTLALTQRIASLEKSLADVRQELERPPVTQVTAPVAAAPAPKRAVTTEQPQLEEAQPDEEPARTPVYGKLLAVLAGGLGVALAVGAWFYHRRRHDAGRRTEPQQERISPLPQHTESARPVNAEATAPRFQQTAASSYVIEVSKSEAKRASPATTPGSDWFKDAGAAGTSGLSVDAPTVKLPAPKVSDGETTVVMTPDMELGDSTVEDMLNFFKPEEESNTTHAHVVLASALNEPPFVERRKNPIDVLRQAIEREPDRSDLRLKLLELYYTAAAENRQAFLEVSRQLAQNEKLASAKEWPRIADMGRAIAPDDELFAAKKDSQAVA